MSEHKMVHDYDRRMLLCAVCKVPWPCAPKKDEIRERIKQQAKPPQ